MKHRLFTVPVLGLVLSLILGLIGIGCEVVYDFDDYHGTGGSGGAGSTSSSSGAGGAGGSAPTCDPAKCGSDSACTKFVCVNDACGTKAAPQGTDCSNEVAGGTCDSGGTCAVCDGKALNSVALLPGGNNINKTVEVFHLDGQNNIIQADSTQDPLSSAKLPVCSSLPSGHTYAMVVYVNGNADVDLTHTAVLQGNVGLWCLSQGDLSGNATQAKVVELVKAGSQAKIIPSMAGSVATLSGNCPASFAAMYAATAQ